MISFPSSKQFAKPFLFFLYIFWNMHLVFFPSFCRCIAASFWYTTATCRSVEKCETIVKDMYCVTHTRVWQTNQGRTQTIMLHSATRGHTLHREHWTNNTSTSSCSQPWAFRYYKNRKMDLNNLKKKIIINWLVVWWAISHTQRNELEIWLAQFNIHIFSHMSKDLRWK